MLLNTNDERIGYIAYDLVSNEESDTCIIRITPEEGAALISEESAICQLLAREAGSAGAFVNLTIGIDLESYPSGIDVDFELKALAEDVSGLNRDAIFLGVAVSGAANWQG